MSNKKYQNPSDVFESQINDLFARKSEDEMGLLFRILSLTLFNSSHYSDVLDLYRTVDLENFSKVLTVFDDKLVKFPKKSEFQDSILFSLCYYYREIENMSWEEIKKRVPFEFSTFSYGVRIRNMNRYIVDQMGDLFKTMEKFKDE